MSPPDDRPRSLPNLPLRSTELGIATFNVRGLQSTTKRQSLARDMKAYALDFVGLQETKITTQLVEKLPGRYVLRCFPLSTRHHGIGFIVSPRLDPHLKRYWSVSDRVGVAEFVLPVTRRSRSNKLYMIVAYGPHSQLCADNPQTRDNFYDSLDRAWKQTKEGKSLTFIAGDFNSKVGCQQSVEEDCMGVHGKGTRNENGQALVDWLLHRQLFLCNTAFEHPSRHRTTWEGRFKPHGSSTSVPVYNTIDFIVTPTRYRSLLRDSRSYAGTETSSDHRLVISRVRLRNLYRMWKKRPTISADRIAVSELVHQKPRRIEYVHRIRESLTAAALHQQTNEPAQHRLDTVRRIVMSAARETVGVIAPHSNHKGNHYDSDIAAKTSEQRNLRLCISNCKDEQTKAGLKQKRNQIQHAIRRLALHRANAILDAKAAEVEKYKNDTRMFAAMKHLVPRPRQALTVHDSNGRILTNSSCKIKRVSEWFQSQFNPSAVQRITNEAFVTGPLVCPISETEVENALLRLNNNRACGPDGIAGELWKYSAGVVSASLASIFNQALQEGQSLDLGQGTLIPLQKPGKPPGPLTSVRPIVLLSTIRKALSLIVLTRIADRVSHYLDPSQSGFRPKRSTADVIWCDRWLAATSQRYEWSCHLLGIDMSRAFDTINRRKLLQVMDTIVDEDEGRMIRLLLDNTTLAVQIDNITGKPFEATIGTPQGDSLSPILFVCYLEAALRDVRAHIQPRPSADTYIPTETEYADDVTFISTSSDYLQEALPMIQTRLLEWDLHVNENKTEWVELVLSNKADEKGSEAWRNVKALGSLLGDQQDICRRKQQAATAFRRMMALWFRRTQVSENRRIRLYKAYVLPVLTYNIGTWGITQSEANRLDAFHRKQLRFLIGVFYPDHITNSALYNRCRSEPISTIARQARWQLFGHILRLPISVPANKAMTTYYSKPGAGRRGRPRTTLPVVLSEDIKCTNYQLKTSADLEVLRTKAQAREEWTDLIEQITRT